jgi:aspartate racemase
MTAAQALNRSIHYRPSRFEDLLRDGEARVPPAVRRTAEFLSRLDIWWELSRNHEAFSCRDAARKRRRLGHEGIELWNELKSYFGRFRNASGQYQYFLAHCRGDRTIHTARLAEALHAQGEVVRVEEEELTGLGLRYGVVNPFETWSLSGYELDGRLLAAPVLQVFDPELTRRIGIPGTVMTNAGDLTWAVEFDVVDFIQKVDNALVADIAEPDPENDATLWGAREVQTIGILTGNAPESGMHLWTDINRHVRDLLGSLSCGDVSMPPVTVFSLPALGLTMELDRREEEIWPHLRKSVVDACRSGVRLLAIACHTTHYFTPQIRAICGEYSTEFVSVAEVLGEWLRHQGIEELALVGIRHVSDLDEWSAYREPLQGLRVEKLSDRAKQLLAELAYQVKAEGATHPGLNRLRDILQKEVKSPTVVLALTELSILLSLQRKPGRSGRQIIDPLALYAEAIARKYLGLPFPMGEDPERS